MCLYCIGNISNYSIKSCGRSRSAHEGTIYAYTKALLGENCLSSNSCHFVKKYFFLTNFLHAYFQYVYIVVAKYQIAPLKAVLGVDRPLKALSMSIQKPYKRKIVQVLIAVILSKKLNQTPSCICSMYLYCIGKVSNCSI